MVSVESAHFHIVLSVIRQCEKYQFLHTCAGPYIKFCQHVRNRSESEEYVEVTITGFYSTAVECTILSLSGMM